VTNMITTTSLLAFTVVINCLPLAFSWTLTPLTIDEHPCKPEKLKYQNRYVCDSKGNVECLTGWKNKSYNVDKHFPCSEPICEPECKNGQCKLPNVCSCDIGWDGLDCGTCLDMPGCGNGGCVDPNTNISEPFKCHCEEGWKGALCDQPACTDHCNNQGKCVVTSDGGRQCNCNLGWKGDTCAECTANVGCILNNTITDQGCQKLDPDNSTLTIDEPNTCQCNDNWQGPFCGIPKCLNSAGNETITCVNGVCKEGGVDVTDGSVIPAFCQCNVGWEGEACDECVPHPECPDTGTPAIDKCVNPYDCICQGTEDQKTADNDFKFCTAFVPPP